MVFFKTRPCMKRNNAEVTIVSSFTSHLMCSTHFTLSCRIRLFSFPTTNNFFKFVYSEITGETAWQVLFRPPQCCLLLWQLRVIRTWLTSILDFWYPGPGFFISIFVFLSFCPVFTIVASCIVLIIRTSLLFFHTCTTTSPFLWNADCPFFKCLPSCSRSHGVSLLAFIVPQTLTILSSNVWANLTLL